ncbi:serine/threonine-protein kinase Nek8-like [Rhodnius prolixus]|uniref:serine/threonine-protein kinase Nek8-like n=1 Tax=Rhodnius prolixus TaxID=13249 RepID=UPI003D18FB6D
MEDFTKGLILGKGSYGVVYSGLSKSNGKKVVLKEIILTGLSDNEVEKTFKEAQILSKLKHPHVIKYYNHSIEKHVLTIFMEYAANGTLKDFLENRVEFLEETSARCYNRICDQDLSNVGAWTKIMERAQITQQMML